MNRCYMDSSKSFEYWSREFHYGPYDAQAMKCDELKQDLRECINFYCNRELPTKEKARIYGDDEGIFQKADRILRRNLRDLEEAKKKKEKKSKELRELSKAKQWINPITGDLEDPKAPSFYKSSDAAIYSFNRKRKFQETSMEIKIARKIYKMKCKILKYKQILKIKEENIPEFSPLHPWRQEEYLIDLLYFKLEIQNMEKQIKYYTDPLTGYNIDIEIPDPKEEKKSEPNFVQKIVKKCQELSKKYIDPLLNGAREFIERNKESIMTIASVAGTVFGAAFKIATIV